MISLKTQFRPNSVRGLRARVGQSFTENCRSQMSTLSRLCEFASVRNPAAQFFASENIFIVLKQSLVNSPNRPEAVISLIIQLQTVNVDG